MSEQRAKKPPVPADATLPPVNDQTTGGPPSVPGLPVLGPPQGPGELGRLGHYRVLKVLGQGGMGMVLQAEDTRLGRSVALKVMLPEVAALPEARERFLREAKTAASIEHDHIVTIYQVDEDRGVPFMAMPLLKGTSLEDYLKRGKPLTLGQVVRIARESARGLQAAHERGLMHRDVKPANLWLDASAGGRVKLLDFGLARPQQADVQLTSSGMILGTPAYMAPEQVAGKPEARSDLYSLGVVLYRLLSGRLPFPQTDTLSLLVAVATEAPPPLQAPGAPPALAGLVMRLLAKKPEDRPASAKVVLEELKAVERELAGTSGPLAIPPAWPGPKTEATAVEPAPRRKGGRLRRVLAALFGLFVLAVGGAAAAVFFVPGLKDRVTAYVQGPPAGEGGGPKDEKKEEKKEDRKEEKEEKKEGLGGPTPPQGFVALFDGKTLRGWAYHGKGGAWDVHDGALRYTGKGRGYLETTKSYGDFELDLEWRLPPRGNSGVFLRLALEEKSLWPKAPSEGVEVQLLDDRAYPTLRADHRTGAVLGLVAPRKAVHLEPDRWHRAQVRCQGQYISVRLNGELVTTTTAARKARPELARLPRRGPIGLQNYGTPVEFRNVFLKELPARKEREEGRQGRRRRPLSLERCHLPLEAQGGRGRLIGGMSGASPCRSPRSPRRR